MEKTVEVFHQKWRYYLHCCTVSPPLFSKFTLKLARVEVVEILEILSDCVWEG
jgi:hypothetical protein